MVLINRREYFEDPANHIHVDPANDLSFPFGNINGLDRDDLRVTAYEIFFTACRSSPGFGGRNSVTLYPFENGENRPGSPGSPQSPRSGVGAAVMSRTKRALGLRMARRNPSWRRSNSCGSNPLSPSGYNGTTSPRDQPFSTLPSRGTTRRPLTSAEIMRQQMKVSEADDQRLRKTLVRALVGQPGQRANTIILPLELLRQLKQSEFIDSNEFHRFQNRQLKILEAGLLRHPYYPLKTPNTFAKYLQDVVYTTTFKPIDPTKTSETIKTLTNCVLSLSFRTKTGTPADVCHWADGYPLNINLYVPLLRSIFDLKDETRVLDEVDEILELMKKTWPVLGITRPVHNLCLTWVLFEQYVMTGQVGSDLLSGSLTMLAEVASDAKRVSRDCVYVTMLSEMVGCMKKWAENRLLDYHESFDVGSVGLMESVLPLVFSAAKILEEDVPGCKVAAVGKYSKGNNVDRYIRSSLRNVFSKMLDNENATNESTTLQEESEKLIQLAEGTEELALREKGLFSSVLKKWHPISAGVAAVTLHTCYGNLLRRFLTANSMLSSETVAVLQRADKLEKMLVNMLVQDSTDCQDGGKTVMRGMLPYDVDSFVLRCLRQRIEESLAKAKDVVHIAKETETWNPKSKSEPYANSAMELMKQTKLAVDSFFDIPVGVSEDLVREFANAVEHILQDYITFVASCGSKQSYVPSLPPLTRCGRGSKFAKLWRKASVCNAATNPNGLGFEETNNSRPSTSRGTQRLYIRLNTLHYILSQLNPLQKNITISPKIILSPKTRFTRSYFEKTRAAIHSAATHVSEVAAYRLIFLDSNSVFYGKLYIGDVEFSRIAPVLKIMKHNITLLTAIVTDRAQPLAMKELMKASFDAYIMVLLAGGNSRNFTKSDHKMIEEDLNDLKNVFLACGDGLIGEDVVCQEAGRVDGVVALMGRSTEELVDEFSVTVYEQKDGQKVAMPGMIGEWGSRDANTMLRVLCHRNESVANWYLKKTFQLPKRK